MSRPDAEEKTGTTGCSCPNAWPNPDRIGDVTLDITRSIYMIGGQGVTAMRSELDAPQFANEDAAFEYVERQLWPHGPVCPHCGSVDAATRLKGKTTRKGLWNCRTCRKPFTVRMG